jgi:hypothetical protein
LVQELAPALALTGVSQGCHQDFAGSDVIWVACHDGFNICQKRFPVRVRCPGLDGDPLQERDPGVDVVAICTYPVAQDCAYIFIRHFCQEA